MATSTQPTTHQYRQFSNPPNLSPFISEITMRHSPLMARLASVALLFAVLDLSLATKTVSTAPTASSATALDTVDHAVDVGVNVEIDVLGIGQAISDAIGRASNREGFVKNIRNTAYYSANSRYNAMVFNLQQAHSDRLRGVKFYGSANYGNVIYGIWLFRSGTFRNKGDGGYINWAFRGCFSRYGGKVVFRKHSRPGRCPRK